MSKSAIAKFLKQLRIISGMSVDEVVGKLQKYGINISTKTLYGYESGVSMLNADVFVALCRIYKCNNPMELFGDFSMNPAETKMIEKYRFILENSPDGADFINTVLNREYALAKQLKESISSEG